MYVNDESKLCTRHLADHHTTLITCRPQTIVGTLGSDAISQSQNLRISESQNLLRF